MKVFSTVRGYGLAIISCGVALVVARPIDAPSSCFLLAVTVSSLFGGLGPGLFCVALSALAFGRFFLRREFPQASGSATFLRFAAFLAVALLVTGLMEIKRRGEESRNRAEGALRQAQADLAHISRVTTLGELTASLAHEVKQPIAAAVTDANTCLRWLTRDHPDLEEAREASLRVVKDATRAAEIIDRIRLLFKKGIAQRELVDVNELIREMIILLRNEISRHAVSVRTELAETLPQVMGDRVQLQQVMMKLIMKSIDAMKCVEGASELTINSRTAENEQIM